MGLKKIGKFFNSIIFAINIIVLFIFLLSSFSDRISPNSVMFFAYLGLLFPFILFINILFAIWWTFIFKWKFLLTNIIIFVICSGQIFTYFPIHFTTKEVPEDCIKVLTYNVMRYNLYRKHTQESPNSVINYILESDADIVCLQEAGFTKNISRLITEEDIDKAFRKKYPYRKSFPILENKSEAAGNSISSKFPIKSVKRIPYVSDYNGSFLLELDVNGKNVSLINNHLESNKLSSGDASEYARLVKSIKDFDPKKIELLSTIMKKRLSVSYRARAKQAESVAEYIRDSKSPYIIVCGDFNDTPVSYTQHTIKGNLLKDSFAETGSGMGISYNRNRFWVRIDYILHSKNIKAYNCPVDKIKDSDHYPVWTYLQLK